ncbi:hypothetical protein C8Q79DRAFT_540000 [Trametes meyenii]|nr:hypothetical protein C8Q79DRAFT_540000 [Trametes meyenii]
MLSIEHFVKIPLLLGAIWAHWVSYSAPSPFVPSESKGRESNMRGFIKGTRPPIFRTASKVLIRTVVFSEVLAILAAHIHTPASAYVLTVLDHGSPPGRGAEQIRITSAFVLGWIIMMSGGFLRVLCYRTLGKHFTFHVTIRKDHRLVTNGPYAIVRHPSYTALALVVLGICISSFTGGSWLRECGIMDTATGKIFAVGWVMDLLYPPTMAILGRVKVEDKLLREEFTAEWDEWARRTPYVLIPGIY